MRTRAALAALLALVTISPALAGSQDPGHGLHEKRSSGALTPTAQPYRPTEYTYEVVASWPHDHDAFTQGLVYDSSGTLYESTGLNGRSSLREVELETGAVRRKVDVDSRYFAEGLTELGGRLYQLTWQHHVGFVYDAATFAKAREFSYTGEGWGLTHDGHSLIMSDGTNEIRFLDPETFEVRRTIRVFRDGQPLRNLNELEYIDGQIYANVWLTDYIARIDPRTGWLTGWIDMSGLLSSGGVPPGGVPPGGVPPGGGDADVLNGIAWDPAGGRIFVTGKLWPKLFEVRFVPKHR